MWALLDRIPYPLLILLAVFMLLALKILRTYSR
jgi:hypothetical protein